MESISLFGNYSLRLLRPEDALAIFTAIDSQREYLGRWLTFVADTLRVEQTEKVVVTMLADPLHPVFTVRCGNNFAGLAGIKPVEGAPDTVEIGYWLRQEHQHKGVMSAAVKTLCRFAFNGLEFKQIEIKCAVENLPSNHIPLRLGFKLARIIERGELLSDGTYTDLNVYSLQRPPHSAAN